MMRKRQPTRAFPIILFVAIVALSGYGLVATGHFSNPFGFLKQTQGGGRPANFGNRPTGNAASNTANASTSPTGSDSQFVPRDNGGPDEAGNSISINWSQTGDVLFNLWYLCATTAVVIVIQKAGGFLIQQVKQRRVPLTA